jgi:hypothetical protein
VGEIDSENNAFYVIFACIGIPPIYCRLSQVTT